MNSSTKVTTATIHSVLLEQIFVPQWSNVAWSEGKRQSSSEDLFLCHCTNIAYHLFVTFWLAFCTHRNAIARRMKIKRVNFLICARERICGQNDKSISQFQNIMICFTFFSVHPRFSNFFLTRIKTEYLLFVCLLTANGSESVFAQIEMISFLLAKVTLLT